MKKHLLIISLIIILLTGCGGKGDYVTITTEPDSYSPTMSSVRGITMTPEFTSEKTYDNIIFHWKTSVGEFVGVGKEAINQGESVTWSVVENDESLNIDEPIIINLAVIESDSENILTYKALKIIQENGFYRVEE
jgi:hypothetical protein